MAEDLGAAAQRSNRAMSNSGETHVKTGLTILALLAAAPLAAQTVSPAVEAALADPGRPPAEAARDAKRHPGEFLALSGIKPGDKVADFHDGLGLLDAHPR
jgi:predicted methyltransferase